ncbi:hypothetical protein T484DRAFT_1916024 [Baffinella frigidus]|nr:hypothetical protein T484DRAFT_1916024 [Cryptophyta sp. CCMP2293]
MEHRLRKKCPVCRWDMADIETLVYNRPLEGVIKQLRLRCEHRKKSASDDPTDAGVVAGGSAAKKSKPCPLIDMTVQMLKVQLAQRSLVVTGNKDALKMRLQESMDGETFDNAGCEWVGSVSEAFAHREVCGFVKLKCPTIGCLATPTRRTFTAHVKACTPTVLCANEGCTVKYKATGEAKHLSNCAFEMVMCPCAGCGMKMPRGQLMKHATDAHIWKTPDGPVNRVITMWNTETIRKQAWESEQRFGQETTGVTSTSYVSSRVVNWACGQTDTYDGDDCSVWSNDGDDDFDVEASLKVLREHASRVKQMTPPPQPDFFGSTPARSRSSEAGRGGQSMSMSALLSGSAPDAGPGKGSFGSTLHRSILRKQFFPERTPTAGGMEELDSLCDIAEDAVLVRENVRAHAREAIARSFQAQNFLDRRLPLR